MNLTQCHHFGIFARWGLGTWLGWCEVRMCEAYMQGQCMDEWKWTGKCMGGGKWMCRCMTCVQCEHNAQRQRHQNTGVHLWGKMTQGMKITPETRRKLTLPPISIKKTSGTNEETRNKAARAEPPQQTK